MRGCYAAAWNRMSAPREILRPSEEEIEAYAGSGRAKIIIPFRVVNPTKPEGEREYDVDLTDIEDPAYYWFKGHILSGNTRLTLILASPSVDLREVPDDLRLRAGDFFSDPERIAGLDIRLYDPDQNIRRGVKIATKEILRSVQGA